MCKNLDLRDRFALPTLLMLWFSPYHPLSSRFPVNQWRLRNNTKRWVRILYSTHHLGVQCIQNSQWYFQKTWTLGKLKGKYKCYSQEVYTENHHSILACILSCLGITKLNCTFPVNSICLRPLELEISHQSKLDYTAVN